MNDSSLLSPSFDNKGQINRTISFRDYRPDTQQESSMQEYRAKEHAETSGNDLPQPEIVKLDSEEIIEETPLFRPLPSKL